MSNFFYPNVRKGSEICSRDVFDDNVHGFCRNNDSASCDSRSVWRNTLAAETSVRRSLEAVDYTIWTRWVSLIDKASLVIMPQKKFSNERNLNKFFSTRVLQSIKRHVATQGKLINNWRLFCLLGTYCPGQFDGWSCFLDTPSNTTAKSLCPPILEFDPTSKTTQLKWTSCETGEINLDLCLSRLGFAHKICEEGGNWFKHPETNRTWSNYTTCIDESDYQVRNWKFNFRTLRTFWHSMVIFFRFFMLQLRRQVNLIYVTGYTISLIAILLSISIFCYFRWAFNIILSLRSSWFHDSNAFATSPVECRNLIIVWINCVNVISSANSWPSRALCHAIKVRLNFIITNIVSTKTF